jgi:hypothetical protein
VDDDVSEEQEREDDTAGHSENGPQHDGLLGGELACLVRLLPITPASAAFAPTLAVDVGVQVIEGMAA